MDFSSTIPSTTAMDSTSTLSEVPSAAVTDHFHIADYVVLVLMLLLSLLIGFYYACFGGRQKTTREYFKGNRNMSSFPVVLSLMASFLSSNGMLGVPAEVYHHGSNYFFQTLGSILGVPFAAYFFLPVFYDLQITSVFEYLQRRFNRTIRLCGSIMSIITLVIYASFVTYGPALALSQVTGLSLWGSILTTTIIGTVYTSLGGIKAVMWTDSVQLIVFTLALLVVIIKGTIDANGFSAIFSKAYEGRRIEPLSFSVDPRVRFTFWGMFIASTLGWTSGYGTSQIQIQRYLCCPSKRLAQRSLWMNFPGMVIVTGIYCFIGIMMYASYWSCDPLRSQQIQQPDQIFPLFVIQIMRGLPGLPGLFVAGVYSASLSTTSSVLNSLSAIALEDYVRPIFKQISDETATKISKGLAIFFGLLCLVVIAAISNLGSIVQATYYLVGGTGGANFGLFTLGLMIPWSNPKGSFIGMCCGLALTWWISLGNQIHKPAVSVLPTSVEKCDEILGVWTLRPLTPRSENVLEVYKMSYLWVTPLAWFVTVLIGSLLSLCIGRNKEVDENLYSPAIRYIMKKLGKLKASKVCQEKSAAEDEELPPAYKEINVEIPMLTRENEKEILKITLNDKPENGTIK